MNTTPPPSQIPWPVKYLMEPPSSMLSVFNWSPQMGWRGTTITVDTEFNNPHSRPGVQIRIVIGEKPILTEIKSLGPNRENQWRCTGAVPDFKSHNMTSTHTFCLTIQAVGECNDLLDQVRFGYFTYRERHGPSLSIPMDPGVLNVPRKRDTYLHVPQLPTPHTDAPGPRVKDGTSSPRLESQSQKGSVIPPEYLRGICRYEGNEDNNKRGGHKYVHQHDRVVVQLDFEEDPVGLGDHFSLEEKRVNRRLVKFICKLHEGKLRVSFHPIRPEQYDERDIVISCIRSPCGTLWYTSVDIIRIIEHIMKGQFVPGGGEQIGPDEKSRIRRNLEFNRPNTVTKQNGPLYKLIMGFPAPKPRHIEKEIKVFEWYTLMAGIIRVVEKYSWCNEMQPHDACCPPLTEPELPARVKNNSHHGTTASHRLAAPYPLAHLTSSDGAGMPVDSRQPNLVPTLHVSPLWLYSQDVTLGSLVSGPPSVGEEGIQFPTPRPYTPPEVSHAIQMPVPAPYEPFHHFESVVEWQQMRGHSTHAGMASSFF